MLKCNFISPKPFKFLNTIYIEGLGLGCPGSRSRRPGLGLGPPKSRSCFGLEWSDLGLGLGRAGLDYNTGIQEVAHGGGGGAQCVITFTASLSFFPFPFFFLFGAPSVTGGGGGHVPQRPRDTPLIKG